MRSQIGDSLRTTLGSIFLIWLLITKLSLAYALSRLIPGLALNDAKDASYGL
jgi:hypothetical protein